MSNGRRDDGLEGRCAQYLDDHYGESIAAVRPNVSAHVYEDDVVSLASFVRAEVERQGRAAIDTLKREHAEDIVHAGQRFAALVSAHADGRAESAAKIAELEARVTRTEEANQKLGEMRLVIDELQLTAARAEGFAAGKTAGKREAYEMAAVECDTEATLWPTTGVACAHECAKRIRALATPAASEGKPFAAAVGAVAATIPTSEDDEKLVDTLMVESTERARTKVLLRAGGTPTLVDIDEVARWLERWADRGWNEHSVVASYLRTVATRLRSGAWRNDKPTEPSPRSSLTPEWLAKVAEGSIQLEDECGPMPPAGRPPGRLVAPPSLAPVPRGHCNRCDQCGWGLDKYPNKGTCHIGDCSTRPPPEPRTHCAGCGAPYETEGEP